MLQQEEPDDYVIATGETHSVKEFCEEAFSHAGLDYHHYVESDPRYFRPAEVDFLLGDASKAKRQLGWEPKYKFKDIVRLMVDADIEALKDQLAGKVYPNLEEAYLDKNTNMQSAKFLI
jgi:GDPmannose 4,6-dehydratase